jgi:hypothetical protein
LVTKDDVSCVAKVFRPNATGHAQITHFTERRSGSRRHQFDDTFRPRYAPARRSVQAYIDASRLPSCGWLIRVGVRRDGKPQLRRNIAAPLLSQAVSLCDTIQPTRPLILLSEAPRTCIWTGQISCSTRINRKPIADTAFRRPRIIWLFPLYEQVGRLALRLEMKHMARSEIAMRRHRYAFGHSMVLHTRFDRLSPAVINLKFLDNESERGSMSGK